MLTRNIHIQVRLAAIKEICSFSIIHLVSLCLSLACVCIIGNGEKLDDDDDNDDGVKCGITGLP